MCACVDELTSRRGRSAIPSLLAGGGETRLTESRGQWTASRRAPKRPFGDGAALRRGVLPLADGRHGAFDAGRNHTAGSEEAQKRRGGGDRAPARRRNEPVGSRLYERRNRRHDEPESAGRRRPRALGKKGCGVAPLHPPGPDDQSYCRFSSGVAHDRQERAVPDRCQRLEPLAEMAGFQTFTNSRL